ncbi:MAG: inositol monophosphatase family protein [Bacteroidetes bacterium]|nr:MAG: inositol monophosphatase family protein [Bacteroidota bacterium]
MQESLTFLQDLARKAGDIMLARRQHRIARFTKADGTWVSEVDLAISQMVCRAVAQFDKGCGLLTEETYDASRPLGSRGFVIDELDGTRSYLLGRTGYTFQAAWYAEGGQLQIGLIYDPVRDLMLYSVRGQGVAVQSGQHLSRVAPPPYRPWNQLRYAHHRDLMTTTQQQMYRRLRVPAQRIVETGCVGSKVIDFAFGKVDALVALNRFIGPWDWAPGKVILEELGYRLSHVDGSPLALVHTSDSSYGYVVAPPAHHEQLIHGLRWVQQREVRRASPAVHAQS